MLVLFWTFKSKFFLGFSLLVTAYTFPPSKGGFLMFYSWVKERLLVYYESKIKAGINSKQEEYVTRQGYVVWWLQKLWSTNEHADLTPVWCSGILSCLVVRAESEVASCCQRKGWGGGRRLSFDVDHHVIVESRPKQAGNAHELGWRDPVLT